MSCSAVDPPPIQLSPASLLEGDSTALARAADRDLASGGRHDHVAGPVKRHRPRLGPVVAFLALVTVVAVAAWRSETHAQQAAAGGPSPSQKEPTADEPTEPSVDPKRHHPWARFGIGSWKKVRLTRELFDDNGQLQSTTSQIIKTKLVGVDDRYFTLEMEVTVQLVDRDFPNEPKQVTRGFHGELPGQEVLIRDLGNGEVEISGRKYATHIYELTIAAEGETRVTTLHRSDDVAPYLLSRRTAASDPRNEKPLFESSVEIVALNMPFDIAGRLHSAAHTKTVHRRADGEQSVTLEVTCDEVPGGVVRHASHKLTAANRTVQRSTLELLDYQTFGKPVTASTGL